MLSSNPSRNCKPPSLYSARVSKHSANNQCFRYSTLITFDNREGGRDELGLPRRKDRRYEARIAPLGELYEITISHRVPRDPESVPSWLLRRSGTPGYTS